MIWTPHVTIAAVIEKDGQFLFVEENKDEGLVLNQPAGHLENNESLIDAVIRETQEETAWQFHPKGVVGMYRWQVPTTHITYLRFCFWGSVDNHRPEQPLDKDIANAVWLSRQQLITENRYRSPLVLTCLDDYLSGKHFDLNILNETLPESPNKQESPQL